MSAPGMPPMMGGGAPHPGMGMPPGGTGAATVPQGQQGGLGQAIQAIKTCVDLLSKAMAALPMGSPIHDAVKKAATDLHKATEKQASDTAATVQILAQLAREKQSQGGAAAMGGAPAMGGARPPAMPMPPPGAGGGPPPPDAA